LAGILVAAVACVASPGRLRAQDSPETLEARERNASGEAFFEGENYESALVEFERVYELLDGSTSRYIVLFNIGQCHERLFRYDRAIEYYERYLVDGGPGAEDRATVDATIRALESLLGTVDVTANVPSGELWIDNRDVGLFDAEHHEFHVPSGGHTIEIRAEGFVPAQVEVHVLARARTSAALTLGELSDYQGLEPWLFWTSAGVGAAALIVGTVFGAIAFTQNSDANALCMNPECRPASSAAWEYNTLALVASIRSNVLVADVLYGVGGLFAVAALTLAFLTDWDGPTERGPSGEETSSVVLLFIPTAGPAGAGITLWGSF